jgi:hypothetical protein
MEQLDILSFSNVNEDHYARFFAHALVAWVFVGMISTPHIMPQD